MLFVNLVGRHMTVETTYKTFAVYFNNFDADQDEKLVNSYEIK